jgi:hypothetical protein
MLEKLINCDKFSELFLRSVVWIIENDFSMSADLRYVALCLVIKCGDTNVLDKLDIKNYFTKIVRSRVWDKFVPLNRTPDHPISLAIKNTVYSNGSYIF